MTERQKIKKMHQNSELNGKVDIALPNEVGIFIVVVMACEYVQCKKGT